MEKGNQDKACVEEEVMCDLEGNIKCYAEVLLSVYRVIPIFLVISNLKIRDLFPENMSFLQNSSHRIY